MPDPKELYQKINISNLSIQDKDKWHDWYSKRHTRTTQISLWLLGKVRAWREWRMSKLQEKVLRKLK